MAKRDKSKRKESDKARPAEEEETTSSDDASEDEGSSSREDSDADERDEDSQGDEGDSDGSDDGDEGEDDDGPAERAASGESTSIVTASKEPADALARTDVADDAAQDGDSDGEEEEVAAGQLGSDRYVLAGFFAAGMLGAYVLGRTFAGIWAAASSKDWFVQTFPKLAEVADDDKGSYSLVIAAIIAIVSVFRAYKRPDVRTWSDEVASELTKVKWPTKKEVQASTIVVLAASAFATIYLTVLDRLWAFVTNLVYGDGI
jgi:preprotein translocase subunit SecE